MRSAILLLFFLISVSLAAFAGQSAATSLKLDQSKTVHLEAGQVFIYHLELRGGQFASIKVEQQSVGVSYAVHAPGEKLIAFDDLSAVNQTEVINISATETGTYRVEVCWDYGRPQSGEFRITWDTLEPVGQTPAQRAAQLMRSWYQPDEPGAAVVVLQNGQVIFSDARGLADIEHGIPITGHTAFELASCSKQFTGFALAMLLDQGRLSLQDDIRKYLPELPDFGLPITVEHLVYHTSGLRDWDDTSNAMGFKPEDVMTLDMIYRMTCNTRELLFPPNDRFSYCNTGYNLLALLVERATGTNFGTWMADHVFVPLDMTDTRVRDDIQKFIPRKANSYRQTASGFTPNADNTSAPGSTSVYSSIDDLGRWIHNFTSGKVGGAGVLKLLDRKTRTNDGKEIPYYAFGNSFGSHKGIHKIEHLGLTSGFRTNITRYPEQDVAIVYLSNDNNDATFSRSWAIADVFLHGQETSPVSPVKFPDLAEALARTEPYHAVKCPVPAAEYEGVYYADEINSHYRLIQKAGVLTAVSYQFTEIDLTWHQPDTFSTNFETFSRTVRFNRDAANRVKSFTLTGGDKDIIFRKLE